MQNMLKIWVNLIFKKWLKEENIYWRNFLKNQIITSNEPKAVF